MNTLTEQIGPGDYYDRMTSAERAALAEGISQADRERTVTGNALRAYIAKRSKLPQPSGR